VVRVSVDGRDRIAPSRTALVLAPDSDCRLVAAPGAAIQQVSFCRTAVEPAVLGDDVDRVLSLLQRDRLPIAIRLSPEAFRDVAASFTRLRAEGRDRKPGYLALQRLCLVEALVLLSRATASNAAWSTPAPGSVEEAVRYVREHFSDDLSLADLAGRFSLNPSYLSRAFGQHTGTPFVEFLNRIRVEKSCLLLKRSRMTILEIALWVGYNNVSWFNRSFRRITGLSPREYRKRARM
jgi:AraC-like DNA-binding protein